MPMTLLAALAALSVGVDVGWQPAEDGGLEYIIQVEPHKLKRLQDGDTISVGIRPELRDVRCYRIVVGEGDLPRSDETLQHSLKAPRDVTATAEIAGPYCPVDGRERQTATSAADSSSKSREEKSIWSAAPSSDPTDDKPPLREPTLTLSPPGSNRDDRWERTESSSGQPESAPPLDAGPAAIGRAENNWAQSDAGAPRPETAPNQQLGDRPRSPQLDGQPGAAMPRKMTDNSNRLVPLGDDPPATQPQPTIRPDVRSAAPPQSGGRYGDVLSGPAANDPPRPAGSRYDRPVTEPDRRPPGVTSPAIEQSPVVARDTPPGAAPPSVPSATAGNRGPRLTPTAPSDLQIVSPPARRPVQFSTDTDVVPAVGETGPAASIPPSPGAGNAVVSAAAATRLPAADSGQPPSTDTAGDKAKTPDAADTESRPWLPLTLCLAALFASLGGNLYLGWMTLEIRRRFQQLAYRARKTADANPAEDGGRRSAEGRSYA